ncbi:retrotransposon gag protein [Cucumis melo var. makuwa]|uniref:Retrotransposon gag protein n=1 Tax=Cucumis melo var. makuwa TaxID=1194695 RepID=A0A5A7SQH8_CUCMM|nr:retrotransposon gag protein [Cucumis melo var. makuwa]TYK30356.1 retrotransposon gag protein [Cucumis melo var. makuwa]
MGEVRKKTLRELAEPDEDQRPICIVIPPTTQPFELKLGLIHLLSIFKGSFGEDPHKHLKDFHMVCDSMRPHEYWERFKELCASFPHHHISDPSLIQYFYSGLLSFDRNKVDAAARGALADKTPIEARELILRMAENSQNFGNRASELDNSLTKEVSELKSQMLNMTTLLTSFVQGTPLKVTKCGVCGLVGYPNDKCPKVIEDVNIVRRYDPHGNTYNLGWRDNPNLRWGNDNQKHTQAPPTSSNQGTNLEDIIALATNTLSFQQEMKQQMTQLTTVLSKMDGKGKLPAQPDHVNVSAISLRSGKILDTPTTKEKKVTSKLLPLNSKNQSKEEKVETNPLSSNSKNDKSPLNDFTPYIPKPPFPSRLAPKKKETPKKEELLEMFKKVQINLPLFDAIQQIPRYAKFLKELCTNKRKTKERAMKLGIELKTLPPHLKYIFLGKRNMFSVIISRELNQKQEERLIEVLKKKKQAIGWTLDDIKGISPTFCMHRIILEEGAKDKIQSQRRLNPTLKEVVMKEVLKLKDVRIIYPVPDSTCVSPIHVVPKKTGMTVMKNDKGEMVLMQMQNG